MPPPPPPPRRRRRHRRGAHVRVSYTVDWLPDNLAEAAFGLVLPALQGTLTSAHARSSAQASRDRQAARNLSRRLREGEDPRSSGESSPILSLPPNSVQSARQSSRNSRSASSTGGGGGGGAHQYSFRDVAVLLALARHRHQSTNPPSDNTNSNITSFRPTTSTPVRMPALTVSFDPSILDAPFSRLLDLAHVPGISTLEQLRRHLASLSMGPGPGSQPVSSVVGNEDEAEQEDDNDLDLTANDPLWIAANLRTTLSLTEQRGASHGDEVSSLQSRFWKVAQTANEFVEALIRINGGGGGGDDDDNDTPLNLTMWDGTGPNENVRPDLLCANATFDAKSSISLLETFLNTLRFARNAELTILSDMMPASAALQTRMDISSMSGETINPDNPHSGALSLIVQASLSLPPSPRAITQMQYHGTSYAVIASWDKGLVLYRTSPTAVSISDLFIRYPPGPHRAESTTFAVFCSLLLSDPEGAASLGTRAIDMDAVDEALKELQARQQEIKRAQKQNQNQTQAQQETQTLDPAAAGPSARGQRDDPMPLLESSSSTSAEQSSPITPTFLHRHLLDHPPCHSSLSPSSSSSRHSPPSKRFKAARAALHISLDPQFASRIPNIRHLRGSRFVPLGRLPEYHFAPFDNGHGTWSESMADTRIFLEDLDSEGLYWTAYRGKMVAPGGGGGGEEALVRGAVVKVCRLAGFDNDYDDQVVERQDVNGHKDVQIGRNVSRTEAIREIEHEIELLLSPSFRHVVKAAPRLYSVWTGWPRRTSLAWGMSDAVADMMVEENKLVVVVMEDVGPACTPLEMYARKDEVLAAFEQLHAAGYIHGDVAPRHVRSGIAIPSSSSTSPSTMTAEAKSRVRLIDFGRTRLGSRAEVRDERQAVQDMLHRAVWSSV